MVSAKARKLRQYNPENHKPVFPTTLLWDIAYTGNLGDIIRTSADFSIPEVYNYDERRLMKNEDEMKHVRKCCGRNERWNRVNVYRISPDNRLLEQFIDSYPFRIATTSHRDATDSIFNYDFPQNCLIMLGTEKNGLPKELAYDKADARLTIPMAEAGDCLNLGTAYGIIAAFYRKQHILKKN